MKHLILAAATSLLATPVAATQLTGTFDSIDGGTFAIEDWRGQPVLVVNTASLCGFTHQYGDLQELQDTYADAGLVVIAVPSDDFRQELGSEDEVKDFCEVNFGLTIPMTTITPVRGRNAHPFYQSLRAAGFTPNWNFNKVLLSPQGDLVGTWRSTTSPLSHKITREIEALLN
ncbi:MAG: glutathione peroxidase [Boseongicola sp.]|nr:glutathione peroxidase [Boseongicola sp.]NNJ69064.1 glutathione peroxidase [Boseongicola sp.]